MFPLILFTHFASLITIIFCIIPQKNLPCLVPLMKELGFKLEIFYFKSSEEIISLIKEKRHQKWKRDNVSFFCSEYARYISHFLIPFSFLSYFFFSFPLFSLLCLNDLTCLFKDERRSEREETP